jgi:hypothetical protein
VEGERCEGRAGGLRRAGFEIMHAWIMVDEAMSEPQTALESPARMAACNWPHYEIASRG